MWTVTISGQAKRAIKSKKGFNLKVRNNLELLLLDLEKRGPVQIRWPNYGKLMGQPKGIDKRHCHLLKGNPTYVVCWEVKDLKKKKLEIYYVGTHEKAPYK